MIKCTPSTGVIVTGGGQGLGQACALALAEAGRPVAIWDINETTAAENARQIQVEYGVATSYSALDVTDISKFAAAVDKAREELGSIGGLVHAAGISNPGPIDELTEEHWELVMNVNLRSFPFLVQALLKDLRANKGSAVVGFGSMTAVLGNGGILAYAAAKAGIVSLTKSLGHALGSDGIRVNSVCPGYTDTPMSQAAFAQNPELEPLFRNQTFLGRIGEPAEVGKAVRFLMSDDASYITAQSILVDAGATYHQM